MSEQLSETLPPRCDNREAKGWDEIEESKGFIELLRKSFFSVVSKSIF
jgi:hypothetical protein